MEIYLVLLIPSELFFFFFSVKNGEHYERRNIGDLIPVMCITKTKPALQKIYFLKLIFSFSGFFFFFLWIVYFSPHLHLVYSFIEISESHSLCLIS